MAKLCKDCGEHVDGFCHVYGDGGRPIPWNGECSGRVVVVPPAPTTYVECHLSEGQLTEDVAKQIAESLAGTISRVYNTYGSVPMSVRCELSMGHAYGPPMTNLCKLGVPDA